MNVERINAELACLRDGGQEATLFADATRPAVLYHLVPTAGAALGLPTHVDVVVPIPGGHPAATIDLAGIEVGSPLLPRVKGGGNSQGVIELAGRQFQLASYHPHNGGGGPPFDPMKHGFHTYFDQILAWLHQLQ